MASNFIIFLFSISLIIELGNKNESTLKVALISIDNTNFTEINKIGSYLESYYDCEVTILPSISIPAKYYKDQSDTLLASNILAFLRASFNESEFDKYMAITEKPIYFSDNYPLIRGLGGINSNNCLVSTNKIKREANNNKKMYLALLKKVSRHEIGHTLGLYHCEKRTDCLMIGGVVDTIFYNAKPFLCDSCASILAPFLKQN